MKVTLLDPKNLLPYERNPRNNDEAVEVLERSISEYGFRQPIVVDENNVILAGHTRHQAALNLGLNAVPVHKADGLSEEQKRSFRIMDNKSAELATWDREMLKAELADIANFDFDMTLTGFSLDEIARLGGTDLEFAIDVDDDIQEEISDEYEMTNVKIVFLYLNTENEPKFREMIDKLQGELGTENLTDTVYKLVENAATNKKI
jgi:ParB-like chromosome segregation protein Spo0J|tara:strand:+ start:12775 stop:13389 length:615 start_codon:yes stop_codon:yes gene_type:complete